MALLDLRVRYVPLAVSALLISMNWGCDGVPPRPQFGPSAKESTSTQTPDVTAPRPVNPKRSDKTPKEIKGTANITPTAPHREGKVETWDRYELQGKPIGYLHFVAEPIEEMSGRLIQVTVEDIISTRRKEQVLRQEYKQTSVETKGGELVTFESEIQQGDAHSEVDGKISIDRMSLTIKEANKPPISKQLSWASSYGNTQVVQQSLRADPLEIGETRNLRALLPIQFVVGEVSLQGVGYAQVPLGDGEVKRLLEIESSISVDGRPLVSQLHWMDETGEILKSYLPALDLLTWRTDREGAIAAADQYPPDLLTITRVSLNRGIMASAAQTRFVIQHREPSLQIPDSTRQRVSLIDPKHMAVIAGKKPLAGRPDEGPVEGDKIAGPQIETEDASVRELAAMATADGSDPMTLAVQLRDLVHSHIVKKDMSQAFASAAEVAKQRKGDCTEHAVLLAAVCRARGIPARLAAGLVQVADAQGFAMNYHLWTLVWDGEQWRPLDAMFGPVEIGPDRIELLTTNLADGNTYSCLSPVLQVLGQIDIQIE